MATVFYDSRAAERALGGDSRASCSAAPGKFFSCRLHWPFGTIRRPHGECLSQCNNATLIDIILSYFSSFFFFFLLFFPLLFDLTLFLPSLR